MDEDEINDVRTTQDFKSNTFSLFKKSDAKNQLIKSLYNNKLEESCYWSIEFICAGQFIDLWEIILFYMSKYIHLGNPKLPIYVELRFNNFKDIISNGYEDQDLSLRNNQKIRKLFSEVFSILCMSKKKHSIEYIKLEKNNDYDISNIHSKLHAPNVKFIENYFNKDDPKELFIMLNEFSFNLSKMSKNSTSACYWLEWLLEFENICKKKKELLICERRSFIPVDEKYQKESIWIIWEIILDNANNDKIKKKIIDSLLNLYCIRYSPGTKKKRKGLIYFAISIITEEINLNQEIVLHREKVNKIVENVNLIYKEIKKNEVNPNTDYLFDHLKQEKSNKEKTTEKLEKLNSLNLIIRN